ncbi:MAG: hypothetical protein JWQ35_48 [Bacteriovoracaceae bacterium]|nr:hypothetical protein [Bacteriovoracaceae bacterium]
MVAWRKYGVILVVFILLQFHRATTFADHSTVEVHPICPEIISELVQPLEKSVSTKLPLLQEPDENVAQDLIAFFKFHSERNQRVLFFPGSPVNRGLKNPITEEEQILSRRLKAKNWSVENFNSQAEKPLHWGSGLQLTGEQRDQLDYWMKVLQLQQAKLTQGWAFFQLNPKRRSIIRQYRAFGIDRDFESFRSEWKMQDRKALADKITKIKIEKLTPQDEKLRSDLYEFFLEQEQGDAVDQLEKRPPDFVSYYFPGISIFRPSNTPRTSVELELSKRLKTRGWIPENWTKWQSIFASSPEQFQKMDEIMQILQLNVLGKSFVIGGPIAQRVKKRLEIAVRRQLREGREIKFPESVVETTRHRYTKKTLLQNQENALESNLRNRASMKIADRDIWLPNMPSDVKTALRWHFLSRPTGSYEDLLLLTEFYSIGLPPK